MFSVAFSSKNVQHANNYFIPNQDWYQIFVLQKSQLLKVSSPVSQDKAHFDTSSDELETYCSSETFHSVNTSPIQKKQASLQRADKYHLQRKSLEV